MERFPQCYRYREVLPGPQAQRFQPTITQRCGHLLLVPGELVPPIQSLSQTLGSCGVASSMRLVLLLC